MVSASWLRRKSSNRSACEPRAPRWTSEINKVRKRRSGHSSLIASIPMREQLADSRDGVMTIHAADATTRIGHLLSGKRIAAGCDNQATASPAPGTARHPLEDDRTAAGQDGQ